jgi:hypothetical protein
MEGLKQLNSILGLRISILTAFREQMRVVYFPTTGPGGGSRAVLGGDGLVGQLGGYL